MRKQASTAAKLTAVIKKARESFSAEASAAIQRAPSPKVAATELLLHNIRDMLREGRASFRGTLLAELLGPYIGNVKELVVIGNEVRAGTTRGYAISVVVVVDRVTK